MTAPNPVVSLYREAIGIDAFQFDGESSDVAEPWQDRPHLCKTPQDQ